MIINVFGIYVNLVRIYDAIEYPRSTSPNVDIVAD